ncbi:MAG: hypothetical protein ACKVPX_10785 [Myxococcaceae bacterium]
MNEQGRITVFAGVNGAGKSSILGEFLRASGGHYFNPDEVTRALLQSAPGLAFDEANARAWEENRKRLSEAIASGLDYAFETTLGGSTIAGLLSKAMDAGRNVDMLYVGLENVEKHIARVQSRVRFGGHDIPEHKIRERYRSSMQNLVKLAPRLSKLRVFDNSSEANPLAGRVPEPRDILMAEHGRIVVHCDLEDCPAWAKPLFAVLLREG